MTTKTLSFTLAALGLTTGLNLAAEVPQRSTASTASSACTDRNDDERRSYCEARQFTVPAAGLTMTVDAAPNGGISVVGEARADIAIRAEVSARADSADQARALAGRVDVTATADRVSASGPATGRDESWSVSYKLVVPTGTPLSLRTTNGGVSIDNVQSRVEFTTVNGGISLKRMGGDVQGSTTNGGVNVTLDGATWNGGGLDVQTSNGGVTLAIPERYSAHLETGTQNGSLRVDIPVTIQGEIGRSFSTDLGSGGPTVRVRTHNGGVKITKR